MGPCEGRVCVGRCILCRSLVATPTVSSDFRAQVSRDVYPGRAAGRILAAWTTNSLGLSLAFGGFLAGMMSGETEFRHQVESSISPFRDVLLGLFFIGIGMRFNLAAIPPIWYLALLGAALILISKTLIVTAMVRGVGVDARVALRTGLMLSVGGEFGLALTAIALDSGVRSTCNRVKSLLHPCSCR